MRILIGADLVPTETNRELFEKGDVRTLLGDDLQRELANADFRVFNLEVPLTDIAAPIDKCGPNLIASTKVVCGYKAIGADILTLANNHILDQGVQGLRSTIAVLDQNKIAYVGAGETPEAAAAPYSFKCDGKTIGVYACAEHEFSIVTRDLAGANPFDPLESLDHVAELKQQCDFVIVLYHGGKEHYRYPSPNLQKVCRKLVEKGADLVVCQHSHCIGCEEKYNEGTIVYGQGNFLFDHNESEYWQTSLLVEIGDGFQISYIPLVKEANTVKLAQRDKAEEILNQFCSRSEQIQVPGFVEENYKAFANIKLGEYLLAFSGLQGNLLVRILNKISGYRFAYWLAKRRYTKKKRLVIRNYIECEAHRELMQEGLRK